MSIASELQNYADGLDDSYDAVNDMGGIVPAQRNMDNLDQAIRTIPQGQGATYTAGYGINIDANNEISVDTTDIAEASDIPTKTSDLQNDGADSTSTYVEADELATVATSGAYADLTGKPTIPTVNNATLTIQKNGTSVGTFTANASSNATANITVPTKTQLYSGGSSSTTTSTLSQAPSNFQYLLIDLVDNDGNKFSIWVPAENTYFTATSHGYANNRIYAKWCRWQISGSTITRTYALVTSSHFYEVASESSNIGVQRVYGIKFP